MNSEIKLTYKDPQNIVHELKLLGRSDQRGFYRFWSTTKLRDVLLHAPLVTMTKGDLTCSGTNEFMEALLDRQASDLIQSAGWHTWRQSGPELGKRIEVRTADDRRQLEQPHSAGELDSLMQRGFSEWRYA